MPRKARIDAFKELKVLETYSWKWRPHGESRIKDDERGRDIVKAEHRVLYAKRIRDEGPAIRRRVRV